MKKNMKKLLVIALALMPSLSINTFAQDNGGGFQPGSDEPIGIPLGGSRPRLVPDEPETIPIKPVPSPNPGHEPHFRNSIQEPQSYYLDGVMYIDADTCITQINASVTCYADNQVWSNAAGTNSLSIIASSDPGEYYLQLTLSTGQSYQGKYIIE